MSQGGNTAPAWFAWRFPFLFIQTYIGTLLRQQGVDSSCAEVNLMFNLINYKTMELLLKSVSVCSGRFVFRTWIVIMILFGINANITASPEDWVSQVQGEKLTSWNLFYEASDQQEDDGVVQSGEVALSCLPFVNISLGQEGYALLTALTFVNAPDYPAHQYVVDIMGPLTNTVYCEQIGQELMVVVTELPTNNSCMSTIYVEDKLKPVLVCTSDVLPCNVDIGTIDFESLIESATDNCDDDLTLWYSYVIQNLPCNPNNYTQQILVNWTATDDSGNSTTCQDIIYLQKPSLGQIVFPPDVSVSCVDDNIDPSITGEPTYNGLPIGHTCQYVVFHSDVVLPMCNGARKVLRTWTVMDWCTGSQATDVQVILIVDDTPPNITCPANLTIGTSPGVCTSAYTLPLPVVSDACADADQIDIDIFVSGIPGIFSPGHVVHLGLGTTLITMRATDPCGNTRICQYSVTVVDNIPPIPACHGINVALGPDGMAVVFAALLDFPIIENCGIQSKQIWRMTNNCNAPEDLVPGPDVKFCCADIGLNIMVAFKVTDLSGNMNTCMFQATVVDNLPPVVQCEDITISVSGAGDIIITPEQVELSSSDNCQIISKTVTPNSFDCSDIGDHVVTLTVTDQSGNTATCTAIVTIVDEVPPVAACQDITVTVDQNGEATITAEQIDNGSSDNCAIDTMFLDTYQFDCDDAGQNNIVTLTVVDFSGNIDMCTATVTVLTSPPVALCQDITVGLDADGNVIVTAEQVDNGSFDDCGIAMMTVTPSTFDCEDIGEVVVVLTVTDISGNTATCTSTVTIEDDMPPIAVCQDISVMLDAMGMVVITAADVDGGSTDNCEEIFLSATPTSFDCEDVGPNIVVLTVTDESGNTSTCTANVMVLMPDPPVALCQDITVVLEADGTITIDPEDLDGGSSTQCGILMFEADPDMFDCDDLGDNIVTLTVTDETGHSSTCTAIVTVEEGPPVAICQNITVSLDGNGEASITGLQVNNNSTDDCGIISYVVVPDDFDCTDLGPNVVTLTVTDGSGNTSSCTAIVTVVDNIPPVALCQDITVALDINGNATITAAQIDNGSTDNCFIQTLTVSPENFDCTDIGDNIVTLTVTDQSGNTSTCTATVTVTALPPTAMCQDLTVSIGANGIVVITPEQVDNNSGSNCGDLELSLDQDTFDCTELGEHIVTLTVTDDNGATSTCTATITVIDDDAPLCSAADITVFVDAAGEVSITADDINDGSTDNCEITNITVSPTDFDCSDLGPNVVTLTVTDQSGNSSTCTAIVTVLDIIDPVCVSMDITVFLDGNGMVTIQASQVDGGSTDNCGPPELLVTPSSFDCDDLGPNVVILTVTDESGNSSTCTATVTVDDSGSLQAFCQNITVFVDANGNVVVDPEDVDNGSGGGCETGELEFDLSQTNFNCSNLGANIVVLTVTDETGATATCTAIITVVDNLVPMITCPANVTVDCHEVTDPNNTGQFGNATATDNCPGVTINEIHVININDCGVGTILRTFTATDASGNTASCTQLVTIANPNPLEEDDITWPVSPVNVNICNSTNPMNIPNGVPVIDPSALLCSDPVITFSDEVDLNVDNDPNTPCQEITRTWTITDDCQPNGTFVFVQTIFVIDMVAPVFTNINDMTKVAGPNCTAHFTLIASATDCAGVSITNNSPYGMTTGANASGDYPIGVTVVIFTATDGCGNISTMDVVITVTDPNPTDFLCEKVIVILPPETEITLNAETFITFIEGNCTTEDDFIISYSRTNPFDTLRTYDCGDVGVSTFSLYFWTLNGTMLFDSCNNADLDLRDPDDFCMDGLVLWGNVQSEDGHAVSGVEVSITNAPMIPDTTNDHGQYMLGGLSEGEGYEVMPFDDENHREGVSTLDLVLIQKHLLGRARLNSPYKMIAADANKSGHITAIDLLEIRKLILGINSRFPNNTSWRFVDRAYSFPDPFNPFDPGFPESVWIDSVSGGIDTVDFVAVKIGDVNASYFAAISTDVQIKNRIGSTYDLKVQPGSVAWNGNLNAELMPLADQGSIDGLQFSMHVGPLHPDQIREIRSDLLTADQWHYDPGTQLIHVSWSTGDAMDLTNRMVLSIPGLSLNADQVEIGDAGIEPEAYQLESNEVWIRPVRLHSAIPVSQEQDDYHLYQNIPNPFNGSTAIRFSVPGEENIRLVIHDLAGRQIWSREMKSTAGLNEIEVRNQDLVVPGIYYYTLYTLDASFTRKLSFTGN